MLKCEHMSWKGPQIPYNNLPPLPKDLDQAPFWQEIADAHRFLGELKGYCHKLPNPELLLSTIVIQESIDSSAIENIVTTQDAMFMSLTTPSGSAPAAVKEVLSYRDAMYEGWEFWKSRPFLTTNLAIRIYQTIKSTKAETRTTPGTALRNASTGSVIYTPPEWELVRDKLNDWEKFANEPQPIDLLVALAMQHYQFEAIHPFTDGNGRTGRVLNNLFLMTHGLLDIPILYLSRFIMRNKPEYYQLLTGVTSQGAWDPWIRYLLRGISETAQFTLNKIRDISALKDQTLDQLQGLSQKIPARQLNDLLFTHPYVKTQLLEEKGIAKRTAASRYLNTLTASGVLESRQEGRGVYYVNQKLLDILRD